eukprot:765170-Hanusia_phi.AAC.3
MVLHKLHGVRLSLLSPVHLALQILHRLQPVHELLGLADSGAEGEEGSVGEEEDPLPQPPLLRAGDAVNLVQDHVPDPQRPGRVVRVHEQGLETLGDGDEDAAGERAVTVGVGEDPKGGVEGAVDLRGDLVDERLGGSDEDEDAVLVPAVPHDLLHAVVGDERGGSTSETASPSTAAASSSPTRSSSGSRAPATLTGPCCESTGSSGSWGRASSPCPRGTREPHSPRYRTSSASSRPPRSPSGTSAATSPARWAWAPTAAAAAARRLSSRHIR